MHAPMFIGPPDGGEQRPAVPYVETPADRRERLKTAALLVVFVALLVGIISFIR